MRSDKAEFELLLTTARILRAAIRQINYRGAGEDLFDLAGALAPFDPAPGAPVNLEVAVSITRTPEFARMVARVCHQANKALCAAFGDMSQLDWNDAPAWQRESAINGVLFCIHNPDAPPSANHEAWHQEKLNTGWTYGPVKDADAKTHPCMVPYDQLPPDQRAKDHVFSAIVKAMTMGPLA